MAQKKKHAKPAVKKPAAKRAPAKVEKTIAETPPDAVGVLLSVSQASEEFGHDRRTITKRIGELGIRPAMERNGYSVYRLRDLMELERRGAEGKQDPDKMGPFERQAHFKAEGERLKVDQARGVLMVATHHQAEVARVLKVCVQELEAMTDEIERDVGASPIVLERIEEKIDRARQRMYDGIVAKEPAESTSSTDEVADEAAAPIDGVDCSLEEVDG